MNQPGGGDHGVIAGAPPHTRVVLAGACLGFLPHNFFRARIFMGDTGSMALGFLLAASTITLAGRIDPASVTTGTLVPTLLPILLPHQAAARPETFLILVRSIP